MNKAVNISLDESTCTVIITIHQENLEEAKVTYDIFREEFFDKIRTLIEERADELDDEELDSTGMANLEL